MTSPTTNCQPAIPEDPAAATVNDMVAAFTLLEMTELSNLDTGGGYIDCDRINMALQDAYRLLTAYSAGSNPTTASVIAANLRRWMMIIARYYLDSVRRREDVAKDYDMVLSTLKEITNGGGMSSNYAEIWSEPGGLTWPIKNTETW